MSKVSILNTTKHSKHTILGDEDGDIENDYDRENDDNLLNRLYKKFIVYKDIPFLLLFIIQVFFLLVYAMYYSFNGFNVIVNNNNNNNNNNNSSMFGIILLCITTSIFISLFWVYCVSYYSKDFIKTSFSATILVSIVSGISMFVSGYLLLGVFLMIFSCSILILFIYLRPRINFATTIIKIAIIAIKELPSLIIITILTLLIQTFYFLIWTIVIFGMNKMNGSFSFFFMFLLLFWSNSVYSNLIFTCVAGSISSFWTDIESPSSGVVKRSYIRCWTKLLGSICLGSLMCALIKTLRLMCKYSLNVANIEVSNRNGYLYKIKVYLISFFQKCLFWIDRLAQYFCSYAFVYLALYDLNFLEASSKVMNLFNEKGLSVVINDEIVEGILFLNYIMVSILTLLTGLFYSNKLHLNSTDTTFIVIISCASGFFMCKICFSILSSAVSTIYVCFSESPEIFSSTHPELYAELASAWTSLYPKISTMPDIDIEVEKTKKNYQPPTPPTIISGAYKALPTDENENQKNTYDIQQQKKTSLNDYIPTFLSTYFDLKEVKRDDSEDEVTI